MVEVCNRNASWTWVDPEDVPSGHEPAIARYPAYDWFYESRWHAIWRNIGDFISGMTIFSAFRVFNRGIGSMPPIMITGLSIDHENQEGYLLPESWCDNYVHAYTWDPSTASTIILAAVFGFLKIFRTPGGFKADNPRDAMTKIKTAVFNMYPGTDWYYRAAINPVIYTDTDFCANPDGKYYLIHPGLGTDLLTMFGIGVGIKYGLGQLIKIGAKVKTFITRRKKHKEIVSGIDETQRQLTLEMRILRQRIYDLTLTLETLKKQIAFKRL